MEFKTTNEIARAWGVSARWVAMCARDGRIPGAAKVGKIWLLPADARKPIGERDLKCGRAENAPSFPLLPDRLARVVDVVCRPIPSMAPETFLGTIEEEGIRLVCEGAIAYSRGNFRETLRCYHALGEQETRLAAASVALAAAISLGDDSFYSEVETFLDEVIQSSADRSVSVFAELALSTAQRAGARHGARMAEGR